MSTLFDDIHSGVGANITASAMYNCCYDIDSTQFKPVSATTVDDLSDPDWILGSSGEFETYDGKIGMRTEYWVRKVPVLAPEQKAIYARVGFWNKTGSTLNSVYCAAAWDWDVPSDEVALDFVSNTSFVIGAGLDIIVIEGQETGDNGEEPDCLDNSTRFALTKYYEPSLIPGLGPFVSGTGPGVAGLQALYTEANSSIIDADWDYSQLGADLVSSSGFSSFAGSDDIHQIMNGGAYSVEPGDVVYLYYTMVTGFTPPPPFPARSVATDYELINSLITANLPWQPSACCNVAGDANDNGTTNIADAIFIINRVFNSGPIPPCCEGADANGNGSVNIADAIYIINTVFNSGPAPVCGPAGMGC